KPAPEVTEHVDRCPTCGDRRRALVPVTTLLAGLPPAPAPAALRRPAARQSPPASAHGRTIRRQRRARLGMAAGVVGVGLALPAGGLAIPRVVRAGNRAAVA